MATKTFYFASGFAYNSDRFGTLQEGGSVTAATGVGWIPGTGHLNDYAPYRPGTTVNAASGLWTSSALPSTDPLTSAPGDGWRSASAITGQFANTDWAIAVGLRSAAANFNGRVQVRVELWKSANADMSGATQIGSGTATATTTANLGGSSDQVLNLTVSPGGITTFSNEYLYLQVACQITSNPSGATQDILWRRSSAAGYGIVTPDFSVGGTTGDASGTTWTVASSFTAGAAKGRGAAGANLWSVTASLSAGAAKGRGAASASLWSINATLAAGSAKGCAAAEAELWPITASFTAGSASGGAGSSPGNASGTTWSVTASLAAGAAMGRGAATGKTLSVAVSFTAGTARGRASASARTWSISVSFVTGGLDVSELPWSPANTVTSDRRPFAVASGRSPFIVESGRAAYIVYGDAREFSVQ